ncbi:MAG TPA: hypothetical protein VHL34_17950 [Rhizomicrobium sp.]|jgi:hypothetical protein|nr:hypothetical protein [Rhizomicrobium sp.]
MGETTSDPYTRDAVAAMRARPGFRAAVEASARGVLGLYLSVDDELRWVLRDRGCYFIGVALVMLHHQGQLTAANLKTAVTSVLREASNGRVRAFLQRMTASNHLVPALNTRGKPSRTLMPSAKFFETFQTHRRAVGAAVVLVDPALLDLHDAMAGTGYPAVEAILTLLAAERPDVFADAPGDGVFYFFSREAGFTLLFDLLLSQPAARTHLLEGTSVSVYGLAKRHGVSRVHVLRLLDDSEKEGWLTFDREARTVRFAEKFSERFERHCAMHFLLHQEAARRYRASPTAHADTQ